MSDQADGPAEPTGAPGRYSRTTNGLIGSMIVVVLAVVAVVVVRGFVSADLDVKPDDLDYRESVLGLQEGGFSPVYPASVPSGWQATNVSFDPAADRPSFGLSFLTDDERFVGLRQEDAAVEDLLAELVEGDLSEGDEYASSSTVASTWTSWSTSEDDHALTTEVGDDTVVVFGSAPVDQLRDVVDSLTTEALSTATPSTGSATAGSPAPR